MLSIRRVQEADDDTGVDSYRSHSSRSASRYPGG
jgi:hypothetical protein